MKKRFLALGIVLALSAVGVTLPESVAIGLIEAAGAVM